MKLRPFSGQFDDLSTVDDRADRRVGRIQHRRRADRFDGRLACRQLEIKTGRLLDLEFDVGRPAPRKPSISTLTL
jgi:hypothetical protein